MTSIESTSIKPCRIDPLLPSPFPPFPFPNSIYSMTGEMNSHKIGRRAAGDDGSSNHSNSTQSGSSHSINTQSQGATTTSSQNSTTSSQSKSTPQSQSTSTQPSQTHTQSPSPSPTNATIPSNSNAQDQNNQTQSQGQGQAQSIPNASSQAPTNSTSPQSSVNSVAPSNSSTPNASKSAPTTNSSVTGTQSKPSNSSQTAAPLSALNSSVPFSTTTASDGFGITGTSSQGDHQLSSSISPATIAGIAIGGAAGLILVTLLALFCYRKRKNQKVTMELQDSEKQKGLKRFSKDSHMFNRLAGNTHSAFDSPFRRNSAPRLDIRMHQHHVSMESEEDRAASAGLSGLERSRSSSLIEFFDQVHIHREPMMTNDEKSSESEHMEFFFINEGAPELSNLVRKGSSSSSVAHSLTTSNSLREMIQKNGRDTHNRNASPEQQPMPVQHEEPFDAATNRNSAIHLMEPSKDTNPPKYSRNSTLSNLSSSS